MGRDISSDIRVITNTSKINDKSILCKVVCILPEIEMFRHIKGTQDIREQLSGWVCLSTYFANTFTVSSDY